MIIGEAELKVNDIGRRTKYMSDKAVMMLKDKIQLQGSER